MIKCIGLESHWHYYYNSILSDVYNLFDLVNYSLFSISVISILILLFVGSDISDGSDIKLEYIAKM